MACEKNISGEVIMNEDNLKNVVSKALQGKDLTKSHTIKIKIPKKSLIKGMTAKEYADHMLWLSKFTDCKEVESVPSNTKRKVQRKTNKSSKSSKANI